MPIGKGGHTATDEHLPHQFPNFIAHPKASGNTSNGGDPLGDVALI